MFGRLCSQAVCTWKLAHTHKHFYTHTKPHVEGKGRRSVAKGSRFNPWQVLIKGLGSKRCENLSFLRSWRAATSQSRHYWSRWTKHLSTPLSLIHIMGWMELKTIPHLPGMSRISQCEAACTDMKAGVASISHCSAVDQHQYFFATCLFYLKLTTLIPSLMHTRLFSYKCHLNGSRFPTPNGVNNGADQKITETPSISKTA